MYGSLLASVDHVIVVQVVDGIKNLSDCLRCIFLGELPSFADSVEKLASRCQLGDYVELVLTNSKHAG